MLKGFFHFQYIILLEKTIVTLRFCIDNQNIIEIYVYYVHTILKPILIIS